MVDTMPSWTSYGEQAIPCVVAIPSVSSWLQCKKCRKLEVGSRILSRSFDMKGAVTALHRVIAVSAMPALTLFFRRLRDSLI